MIIKKQKQDSIEIDNISLDSILKEKEKDFINNIFPNFSMKEKVEFIENNKILDYFDSNPVILYICSCLVLSMIAMFCSMMNDSLLGFMSSCLFLPCTFLVRTKLFKSRFFNSWLSKKHNLNFLKNEMFKTSIVSQDVLKVFIDTYGNERVIEALVENEHLTYADLQFLIKKEKKLISNKDKTSRVKEALTCL